MRTPISNSTEFKKPIPTYDSYFIKSKETTRLRFKTCDSGDSGSTNPAHNYVVESKFPEPHIFRVELESFVTCADVEIVLLDLVEWELKNFELVLSKNNPTSQP